MKLRRLELLGFKSFRTRVALEISDGVTVVVGPNGCGKSNIVDAIRWTLGAQSARELRGRSMEDVIFGGSEHHRPAGFAEVTLTFDNATGVGVGAFRQAAEIAVTRRLFRTGESVYEMNGQRVRLRDVQEMFLGTGVGVQEGYSIIEQGRVGAIVSARPEERRSIIEEAAGITRYRFQRKQAERKLEQTSENLQRVGDILNEVRRQARSLEAQAEKARTWKRLQSELRVHTLHLASERLERACETLQAAQTLFQQRSDEARSAEAALRRREAALESVRVERFVRERRLQEATEAAHRSSAKADLLQQELDHATREEARLVALLEELARDRAALDTLAEEQRAQFEGLEASQQQAASQRVQMEERLHEVSARWDEVRESRETLREELRSARSRAETLGAEHARRAAEMEVAEVDRASLERRLRQFQEDADALDEAALQARERCVEAELRLDDGEAERHGLAARVAEAREREQEAMAQLSALQKEERKQSDALARAQARVQTLEGLVASGEGYGPWLRRLLQDVSAGKRPGVGRPLLEALSVDASAQTALLAALGPRAHALPVANEATAIALLDEARRAAEDVIVVVGPAALPPAERHWIRVDSGLPDGALAWLQTLAFEETGAGTSHAGRTVRADGTWSEPGGWWGVPGKRNEASRRILERQEELVAARASVQEAREACDALHDRVASAEEAGEHALLARQRCVDEAHEMEERVADARRAVAQARAAAADAALRLQRVADERTATEKRHQERVAALVAARETSAAQELERRRVEAACITLEGQWAQAEERWSLLSEERTQTSVASERATQELRAAERALQDAKTRALEASSRAASLVARIERAENERERTVAAQARAMAAAGKAREEASALEAALQEARSAWEEHALSMQEVEVELTALRRTWEEVGRHVQAAETAVDRAGLEEAAAREAREALQPSEDERAIHRDAAWSRATAERARRRLEEEIQGLGHVNPAAEEAWEEARARQDELEAQEADLVAARTDLLEAIRRMNETCEALFAETFHAVNDRFQVLFPRLFNGGQARLALTQPESLLETGVEIFVQPPGKRVQAMTLLSGGEKALSAVALIFAIFQLKPAPFSILDEVDAPLDEGNVGRYADMVREMSDTSQFLVITHNKRTMEAASLLYGVTMEEPGVSRVVGVRFHDEPSAHEAG